MIRRAWLIAVLLLAPFAARAEEIVVGLSQDEVAITASFTGSDLLIFGAVRRESPPPTSSKLDVIIAVTGPNVPVTVRQKERVAGIWVNTKSMNLDIAPSFYAVATTGPMDEVLKPLEDLRYAISIDRAVRSVGQDAFGGDDFATAFARIQESNSLVQLLEGAVSVDQETLFRTRIKLPANITEGDYKTRIFLARDGLVVDQLDTVIPVYKVGVERWLFTLSQEDAWIYGIMALVIAVAAGWAASAGFALLRR